MSAGDDTVWRWRCLAGKVDNKHECQSEKQPRKQLHETEQ